jgi:hypothetical protein
MLLTRDTARLWPLLAILLTPAASFAEGGEAKFTGSSEAGTGSVEFRLGFYHNDDDGDGNPFLDERLTVVEPILLVDYNITDRLGIWAKLSYDYISSASIERLSNFSNQSGASGDNYFGGNVGVRYELDEDLRIGGFIGGSGEYDYTSFGFGGDVAKDLADKNTTLKLSVNAYFDWIDVIRFNGKSEGTDNRYSASTTLSWYQVINEKTHADLGFTLGYQNGFLETAYNAVVIENPAFPPNPNLDNNARGIEVTEELPSNRVRGAVFGKLRRFIRPGTSLQLGGRLYYDSWGIFSGAVEPSLFQSIVSDRLMLRVDYRYYSQTEADYFKRHFKSAPKRRTQDSDLSDFDSHGLGAKLAWRIYDQLALDIGGGYTFREDGLDYVVASFGLRWDFDVLGGR